MRRHRHGIWGGGRFMNGGAAGRLPPDVVHQRALAVTACACAHAAAAGHDPGRAGRPAAGPGKPEHGWLARPAQVPGLGARHPEHGRAGHRHLRTARAAHHWCAGAGPERQPLTPPCSSAQRRLSACEHARRRCAAAACLPQERRLPHKHASTYFNTVLLYRPLCRASRVTGLHSGSRPGRAAGAGEGPPGGRHILVVFL